MSLSPDQLRRQAAAERALAERARAAKERAAAEEIRHLARAQVLEEAAAGLESAGGAGHHGHGHDTVTNVSPQEHGLATSRGRAKDPLVKAANKHDHTLRSLAEKVGLGTHSILSMARRGERPLKRSVAEAIERLTGFSASPAHWPGGITDDE